MTNDIKSKIGKMLFHLSTENRAAANEELKSILQIKVQKTFDEEYAKVQASFSKESK